MKLTFEWDEEKANSNFKRRVDISPGRKSRDPSCNEKRGLYTG